MREVIGKRVGVRWNPPALVYVYQLAGVLRLARIPLRNLQDEDLVEQVYKKHENGLLEGLEKRYVRRMVDILRHHHGIESPRDKRTESSTSERGASSASRPPSSYKSGQDVSNSKSDKPEKEESIGSLLPRTNKLVDIQEAKPSPTDRLTRGTDILLLLDRASKSGEEHEPKTVPDQPVGPGRNLQLPKLNRSKLDRENDKEILDSINKDLSRVQRDKRTLVDLVNKDAVDDMGDNDKNKDVRLEEVKTNGRRHDTKVSVDESEDTDVDLEDLDIPLDPEEPARDPLDDDDFWS